MAFATVTPTPITRAQIIANKDNPVKLVSGTGMLAADNVFLAADATKGYAIIGIWMGLATAQVITLKSGASIIHQMTAPASPISMFSPDGIGDFGSLQNCMMFVPANTAFNINCAALVTSGTITVAYMEIF